MTHRQRVVGGATAVVVAAIIFAFYSGSPPRGRNAFDPEALGQPIASELAYSADSLRNGLHYFVSAHASSNERTELRLVVDAGSMQEEEDQRGLAHAVEHMVFRGTRTFPHGAIDRWFDRIGMRRGDDVNAFTSFDDTQYRMTVPSSRPGSPRRSPPQRPSAAARRKRTRC